MTGARVGAIVAPFMGELGDGVFATMRAYRGRCFRAREHLAVLARGAAMFGLRMPDGGLMELARRADEEAAGRDVLVRVTLGRTSNVTFETREVAAPAGAVAASIVSLRRIPASCMDPTVKTTSYGAQVLARREAEARGAFEGLQLAVDGALACGAMSNVFVVARGELLTPSLESGCRDGVTRRAVIELAASRGRAVREARVDPKVLDEADEVFLTSARLACVPIATIDGRRVGDGTYPRAAELAAALNALALRETSHETSREASTESTR